MSNLPLSSRRIRHLLTCRRDKLQVCLLRHGNEKLGRGIFSFGLPAIKTCPGWTPTVCGKHCYARRGHYLHTTVGIAQAANLVAAHRPDFSELVLADMARHKPLAIRIHDSGDFFSPWYARSWLRVMLDPRSDGWKFFLYTRSWRIKDIEPVLREMSQQQNCRVWYSTDRGTGEPRKAPPRVRLAYMQEDEDDVPSYRVDLFFRTVPIRNEPIKFISGSLVCPYENGATRRPDTKFSCATCQLCFGADNTVDDPRRHRREFACTGRKLALTIV
jgi:hypothetical protein